MASCKACDDLRTSSSEFMLNGVTPTVCTSLKNDTGFNPASGHNDCTDLDDANDCLIGTMEDEIEAYDVCDWKEYMKKFVPNVYNVIKAIICAVCGIWTNIKNLWTKVNKHDCLLKYLAEGKSVKFTEDEFDAGSGVDFNRGDDHTVDVSLILSGNIYTIAGSINVTLNGSYADRWGKLGMRYDGDVVSGNRINTPDGNWTICVLKIKKSKYPWIKNMYSTVGTFVNSGVAQLYVQCVDGDSDSNTYAGQWGNSESGRKTVPAGWLYVRVSLIAVDTWGIEYGNAKAAVTFRATGMSRLNPNELDCD